MILYEIRLIEENCKLEFFFSSLEKKDLYAPEEIVGIWLF